MPMAVLSSSSPVSHTAPAAPVVGDANLEAEVQAFGGLLQGIAVIAGLTHLSFLALFLWAKVDALAIVNVASVLSYVWAFMLARKGDLSKCWAVTVLEVLGHAILATVVIGWDSGFHHYILLVIPVAVISTMRPWLKSASVLSVALTYIGLTLVVRHHTTPYVLAPKVLDGLYYFNVAGTMLILAFLAACYYYMINKAQDALREMATTDPLTRLRNRRSIMEAIRFEEQRVKRGHPHLSFILCDLDHFKQINDTHGHDAGDAVLRAVSHTLTQGLRKVDIVSRWGGEEFLLLLPDTDLSHATAVAERLRGAVEGLNVTLPKGPVMHPSMTVGVASLADGETVEQTIARADAALYEGKRGGRNRVIQA